MATIRGAVLASGNGTKLQSLLDSIFFGEIPELKLLAVISSDPNAYALVRAKNAGLETIVVEPGMFPNASSYDMAIRNKIKDLDIDFVIDAGFRPGIASLLPAFADLRGLAVHEEVLRQGLKLTGATAYLVSETGGIGPILLQTAVPVLDDDDAVTLQRRVLTDAEWSLVAEATKLWCAGKFELRGGRAKRKA